jgi:hypothetical protein
VTFRLARRVRVLPLAGDMVAAMSDEARFLKAWIRGVKLTNRPHVFGDGTDPDQARTKWDLCPIYERVEDALDTMSSTERILLAAMYSFYNDAIGAQLLQRACGGEDPIGLATITAALDDVRRAVIGELLMTYRGW